MVKRILSVILAVCMLGSVAVVAASAEETTEKTFNYVALGDSIAAGYGLTAPGTSVDPALILSEELIANPVKEAYAHVFGERLAEIGAEYGYTTTATNLSSTAYRAEDVATTITTPGFKGTIAASILEGFVGKGTSEALVPYHDIYTKYLTKADMVSIQLGGNDIIMGIIYPVYELNNPILNDVALSVTLLLFGLSPEQAIGFGIQQLQKDKDKITMEHIAEATKYFASVVENSEQLVLNAADKVEGVVNAVRSVNPTADIALVGMYNPYGNSLEYDGQIRDVCNVCKNIFARAIDEVADVEVEVEPAVVVPADQAEEKTNDLCKISAELKRLSSGYSYYSALNKARVEALLKIAAEELAYPIQYLTAGKSADPQMRLLNEKVQEIAERNGATYVDVYDISNECNTDPHPTAKGHAEIAERLEATMTDTILARMGVVRGDVNDDGDVTVEDVTLMQQFLAEFDLQHFNNKVTDSNGDGVVNVADITIMQRKLAELL